MNPGQALPVPEDEDIYVSLQVLQTQLNARVAPAGTHELLERVLSKVDKLQATVDNISVNYESTRQDNNDRMEKKSRETLESRIAAKDVELQVVQTKQKVAQQEIIDLQNKLVTTKADYTASYHKEIDDLRNHIGLVQKKVERQDRLEQQLNDLQIKVEQLASVQQEKAILEDKYRIEQIQNNALLRRNWFLESENNKLKKTVSDVDEDNVKEKERNEVDLDYDTILFPIEDDVVASVRAILEQEQREKTGHAARA